MTFTSFNAAILTLAMLLSVTLEAPLQSEDMTSPLNETATRVTGSPEDSLESSGEGDMESPVSSCPNYHPGNPALRNKTGCVTGTMLDPVDHEMAFGFQKGQNPNWTTCGIPRIPQAKWVWDLKLTQSLSHFGLC